MRFALLLLLGLAVNTYGQEFTRIDGRGFKGYIVDKDHFVFKSIENHRERYTPTAEDVKRVETILSSNEEYLKQHQLDKSKGNPIIYKNLRKYIRQYVGFIDKSGDRILWINLIYRKDLDLDKVSKDLVVVYDGGSYYWSICINVTKGNLYDMKVNGNG